MDRRSALFVVSIVAVLFLAASAAGMGVGTVRAADPSPAPSATVPASGSAGTDPGSGDVRTTPAAPGLVGDPLFAVGGVIVVAAVSVGATLLAMRLDRRRS